MAKAAVVETTEQATGLQPVEKGPGRLVGFLHDVREEMRKVVTPTRMEVQNGTLVVLGTVAVFAAYFWLVDVVIGNGVDRVFTYFIKH